MGEDYFDFQEISQEDEQLDFSRRVDCPHCKKPIPQDATMCLYCGQEVYCCGRNPSWVVYTAIFLVVALIIFFLAVI